MKIRKTGCILLALLTLLALVSCAAKGSNDLAAAGDVYYEAPSEKNEGYFDYSYSEKVDVDVNEESFGNVSSAKPEGEFEEKIILTVSLRTETKEYDTAIASLRAAIVQFGGYEESFQSHGRSYGSHETYRRSASLTVRVPAEKLSDFLSEVGELVNVVNEQNSMTNATTEYYDLGARLSVLESERVAYEAMLEKAVNVEEVLLVKDRLYDVIAEIESIKTRMKVIDSRADYSTVYLTLSEVVDYSTVTTTKTTFGARISGAFGESWRDFWGGCQDLAVWFVGAIPTILVLAVIGGGLIGVLVSLRKKRRVNKENK